ncbi:unnamed protein product [Ilex paraguariensis]|uniref:Dynein light chain n=1 Tax=Ilex paraguariensis TaxID=185542 RepID=A0ABC8RKU2_9AQUA
MSEEARRIGSGALEMKPSADDRRPSSAASPLQTVGKKVIIKSADMKDDMQKEAVDIAIAAFEKNSVEKDVAEQIKKEFDKKHGPTWHCIVGKNFVVYIVLLSIVDFCRKDMNTLTCYVHDGLNGGSYVTHETNHFVYFYLDSKAVLLFKSG